MAKQDVTRKDYQDLFRMVQTYGMRPLLDSIAWIIEEHAIAGKPLPDMKERSDMHKAAANLRKAHY